MNVAIPAGVNNEGIVPAVVTARVSMQYVHIGRRTMGSIEHLTYLCIASEVTSSSNRAKLTADCEYFVTQFYGGTTGSKVKKI